jgi:hypothetical protein
MPGRARQGTVQHWLVANHQGRYKNKEHVKSLAHEWQKLFRELGVNPEMLKEATSTLKERLRKEQARIDTKFQYTLQKGGINIKQLLLDPKLKKDFEALEGAIGELKSDPGMGDEWRETLQRKRNVVLESLFPSRYDHQRGSGGRQPHDEECRLSDYDIYRRGAEN